MADFFSRVRTALREFFAKLNKKERIRLAILAAVVITLAVVAAVVLSRTTYSVLYPNLEPSTAGEILAALEEMGVPTRVEGTGTILVPADRADDLRMRLSAQGFNSEQFNYEGYFNNIDFGTTDSDRQVLQKMQAELQLQDTINRFAGVVKSFVVVNLPTTSSFVIPSNNREASVLVQLILEGSRSLTTEEANNIGQAVMVAVPGLKLENIRIIDGNMHLYPLGDEESDVSSALNKQLQLEKEVRETLEKSVLDLLAPVFGDKIKTMITVKLNFDNEVTQIIEFAPPVEDMAEGLAVSARTLYEDIRGNVEAGGVVGTDENGLGTVEYPWGDMGADEYYRKRLDEINYELNKTTTEIERAKGGYSSLNIGVLIDSVTIPEDYTAEVTNLVATALGVNERYVSIQRLPFQDRSSEIDDALQRQQEMIDQLRTRDLIRTLIQWGVILALVLAILFFARSIIRTIFKKEEPVPAEGIDVTLDEEYIPGMEGEGEEDDDFDMDARSETIQQLERFIDKNPQAVVQLLRNWISED